MRRMMGLLLACMLVCASLALASDELISMDLKAAPGTVTLPADRIGDCTLGLTMGGNLYYFAWEPANAVKLYLDPETDIWSGDCMAPFFPLQINSVDFYLYCYDPTAVGYTATINVDVECPANTGMAWPDKCTGPGEVICQQTINYTFTQADYDSGSVFFEVAFEVPCCIDRGFFVGIELASWDGPVGVCPGPLADQAQIPNEACRVWDRFSAVSGGITFPPCWFNVPSDYVTPWGPWLIWANITTESDPEVCPPAACLPCPHTYPGDDVSDPIVIDQSVWSMIINPGDFCSDYDMLVDCDLPVSFSGAGPDFVLELSFAPEIESPCFTITLTPLCEDYTFFRMRTWMNDSYGTIYTGNPAAPGVMAPQVYDFTAAGVGCLYNDVFHLFVDVRNDHCFCPIQVDYVGDLPLPVELAAFTATAGDSRVTLNWITRSEMSVSRYDVVRDGVTIANVAGLGDSPLGHTYTYVDRDVVNGTTYTYNLTAHNQDGTSQTFAKVASATPMAKIVTEYALSQNYPNPFNPSTMISYALKEAGLVTLKVYTIDGREVVTLVNANQNAGEYNVNFNGDNLASGVYLYRLDVNGFSATHKMVLMK